MNDLHFFNVNNGIIVGDAGTILRTNTGGLVSVEENIFATQPNDFVLHQNYPNPFFERTTIRFNVPNSQFHVNRTSDVLLKVYDAIGRDVKTLFTGELSPGSYEMKFDGNGLMNGQYFVQLQVGEKTKVIKAIVIR